MKICYTYNISSRVSMIVSEGHIFYSYTSENGNFGDAHGLPSQLIPLGIACKVSIPTLFIRDLISADNRFTQSQGKNCISLSTYVGQKIARCRDSF